MLYFDKDSDSDGKIEMNEDGIEQQYEQVDHK